MDFLKKYKFTFIKTLIFGCCFLFIFSGFNTKLSILKFSRIIEVFNGDFYSNLTEKNVSDYLFLYDTNESEQDINKVVDILKNNNTLPYEMLQIQKVGKPTIKLLSKFNTKYSESLGYVYFHNNVITILNSTALSENSSSDKNSKFIELISHEYTHFLINTKLKEEKLFPKAVPLWFNEGIAEYVGVSSRNGYIPERLKTIVKLSELNDIFNEDPDLFYNQSVVFINYLIKNYGYNSIGTVLENLKNNEFKTSIEIVTGETLDEISLKLFNLTY